ncbi:hypothetical protein GCM10025770_09710 [Viridibacterium curvum]|uniref:Uncharacterized protein n=1 Tax=Viridibacterium curvum TaxID=1101404 RepID=A0ABP9QFK5_9RHOO
MEAREVRDFGEFVQREGCVEATLHVLGNGSQMNQSSGEALELHGSGGANVSDVAAW